MNRNYPTGQEKENTIQEEEKKNSCAQSQKWKRMRVQVTAIKDSSREEIKDVSDSVMRVETTNIGRRWPWGHFISLQFSRSVVSDSLQPHEVQHAMLLCPSPTPAACSNSCPSSWWCHPTISSSNIPISSCLQSFPASGSFPVSQFFASGGQSFGVLISWCWPYVRLK